MDVKYVFPEAMANFTIKIIRMRGVEILLIFDHKIRTSKGDSNIRIVRSKVFLNDTRCLHRFDRQVPHHHPFVELPHHYESISGKF